MYVATSPRHPPKNSRKPSHPHAELVFHSNTRSLAPPAQISELFSRRCPPPTPPPKERVFPPHKSHGIVWQPPLLHHSHHPAKLLRPDASQNLTESCGSPLSTSLSTQTPSRHPPNLILKESRTMRKTARQAATNTKYVSAEDAVHVQHKSGFAPCPFV